MGIKTFRSEEERLLALLDETQGPYPFLTREDPVIFYNNEYEKDLLMEYNLEFDGGESSSSSTSHRVCTDEEPSFLSVEEPKLEPSWLMSPSESENPASPSPYMQEHKPLKMSTARRTQNPYFNPYSSGPLVKEPCNSRSRGYSTHMVYRDESPSSKRGRPSKVTSNSKMANYARNYREQKKNEMSTLQMHNSELEAELRLAREENAKMKKALAKASDEITQLKKVIDQDSQIARVVATMGSAQSAPGARAGVCVHVGALGTTVEVCKQCADNNQMRMDSKFTDRLVEDLGGNELFGGDFSAFDSYLNDPRSSY